MTQVRLETARHLDGVGSTRGSARLTQLSAVTRLMTSPKLTNGTGFGPPDVDDGSEGFFDLCGERCIQDQEGCMSGSIHVRTHQLDL